ncbi:MAG: hypothetical protein RMJ34_05140 [candidate division WOR-3 bacterium]|nr:hypothetical protein [candidate division WOR-3 bacterium]MDW8114301.1 hypothetical protein [candidate division WOR-3 bacterium]
MNEILVILFLFSQPKWVAYKETLFPGEPIIPILCYKNSDLIPQKILRIPPYFFEESFYTIFENKEYKIFRVARVGYLLIDTIVLNPSESIYLMSFPIFYGDFRLRDGSKILPFRYGKLTIYIPPHWLFPNQKLDSFSVFFKEPPKERKEFHEYIKNLYQNKNLFYQRFEKLKYFVKKYKDTLLLPYVLWNLYINHSDKKYIDEMRRRFPNHILTEDSEFRLCKDYFLWGKELEGYKLYKKLKEKYPFNYGVKDIEARFSDKIKKFERK